MEITNLKEVLDALNSALKCEEYKEDFDLIKKLFDDLNDLKKENINRLNINDLEKKCCYLETKYFNIFDFSYYIGPLIASIKKIIHTNEVTKIRLENRKKKEGK